MGSSLWGRRVPEVEGVSSKNDGDEAASKAAQIEQAVAAAIASLSLPTDGEAVPPQHPSAGQPSPREGGADVAPSEALAAKAAVASMGSPGSDMVSGVVAAAPERGEQRVQRQGPPADGQPAKGAPAKGPPVKGPPANGQPTKGAPAHAAPGQASPAKGSERRDASPRMPRADTRDLVVAKESEGSLKNDVRRAEPSGKRHAGGKPGGQQINNTRKRDNQQRRGRPRRIKHQYAAMRAVKTLATALVVWFLLLVCGAVVLSGNFNPLKALGESAFVLLSADMVSAASALSLSFIIVLLVVSLFSRGEMGKIADEVLQQSATAPLVVQSSSLRTEIAALAEKLETVIVRASDLELTVRKEITALEGAYSENEIRTERLLKELEQQRHKIVQHVIDVKNEAKELEKTLNGNANAAVTLLRATHEEVVGGLSEAALKLREALKAAGEDVASVTRTSLDLLSNRISDDMSAIEANLDAYARRASGELGEVASNYRAALEEQGQVFERGLQETFAASVSQIDDAAARLAQVMRAGSSAAEEEFALAGRAFDAMISQKAQQVSEMLQRSGAEIDSSIKGRISLLNKTIDEQRGILADLSQTAESVGRINTRLGKPVQSTTSVLRREGELMSVAMEDKGRRAISALQRASRGIDQAAERVSEVGREGLKARPGVGSSRERAFRSSPQPESSVSDSWSSVRASRVVPFPRVSAHEEQPRSRRFRRSDDIAGPFSFVKDRELRETLNRVKDEVDGAASLQASRLLWMGDIQVEDFRRRVLTSFGAEVLEFVGRIMRDRRTSQILEECCGVFVERAARCNTDDELLNFLISAEGRVFTIIAEAVGCLPAVVEEILAQ